MPDSRPDMRQAVLPLIARVAERPVSSDKSVNARVANMSGRSHLHRVKLGTIVSGCQGHWGT